jgi:outer membrane protein TolC
MKKINQIISCGLHHMVYLGLLLCLAMMTGCAIGPDFQPPKTQVPDKWTGPTTMPATELAALAERDIAEWWTVFQDPTLTSLVERAVQSNLDMKLAEARIRQARAARGVAVSDIGPKIDATGSFRRSQSPGSSGSGAGAGGDREGPTTNQYQSGFDAGWELDIFGGLDVANANAQVATTAARIPVLEVSARQTIYNLSVLLGREPAALMQELSAAAEIPAAPPSVPVGVPSELLRRRPDIRRAETEIHAATARIGVATADLFPKVMLSGSIGYQDGELNSLFDPLSRFWSLGSLVSWQVFDTGRISSNIEVRKALEEQSVIAYQQMVLAALQEVENALIASAKEQEHRKALVEAVAANRKAVELATKLYSEGQTDFLNVLSSQRSLYLSEDTLAQSTRMISTNLVVLYKALGGGWEKETTVKSES